MLAVKDKSNVVRAVCDRYATRFMVELPRPSCMAELYGQEFADWAHAEDERALRLGLSVSLSPSRSGPIKTLRAPLDDELIQVRVTDAAEDLDALLAIRWPELSDEARRVLWAVTGWASPSGVAQIGDLEQLAARAGIAEPRTARLLLELAQRGALGLSGGEAEAIWLPPLLRGEVLSEPQERLVGVQRGLEALTAAVEGLASGGRLPEVRGGSEKYRVRIAPPRKGRDRGCWCLRVYGPGVPKHGRRELTEIVHSSRTRAQAEGAAHKRERELNDEGVTLLEVVDRWLAHRESERLAKRTLANYRSARLWLSLAEFGGLGDGDISPAQVMRIRDAMRTGTAGTGPIKTGTARNYMRVFSRAWNWAHLRAEVSQAWPGGLPRWVSLPGEKTRKMAYTEAELAELLDWLAQRHGGRWLLMGWLLAETGARAGVVAKLRVGAVSLRPDGSAEVALGRRLADPTKSRAERIALISPELAAKLDLGRDREAWLFPSSRWPERRHASAIAFAGNVREWVKSRGLFGLRDVHSLRRRGAAALTRGGVPAEIGARILGQTAKVFLGYAEKAHYELTAERRMLWLSDQQRTNGQTKAQEDADSVPESQDATCARSRGRAGCGQLGGPQPASLDQFAGRRLRWLLERLGPDRVAAGALRATFGGGAG